MIRYIAALAVYLASLSQLAQADELFKSVQAAPGGHLEAELSSGSIQIETHDEERVSVEVHARGFRAGSVELELEGDDGDAELSIETPGWFGHVSVRARVWVPEDYSLEIDTSGGDIRIEGVRGNVEAQTGGGRISVDGVRGRVELKTSGGGITVDEVDGDLSAETSGGRIRVADVTGRVEVRTSGGPLEIRDVGGPVMGETSGGNIYVRFLEVAEGDLETSGGSIDVEFPEDAALDLEAHTSGGRVRVDADLVIRGEVESGEVRGRINGGGPRLRLDTSGGNIRVSTR